MAGRLFLHMGAPKTATSSVQKFLFDNREFLHRRGYHYLQTGLSPKLHCHHDLIWALGLHPGLSYVDRHIRKREPELLGALSNEAKRYAGYDLILSSELLFFLQDMSRLEPLLSCFEGYEIHVVMTLRRQDAFLESLYQQIIKDGGTVEFREWFARSKTIGNYHLFVKRVLQIVGREQIHVDIFDARRPDFHPVKNFLESLGFGLETLRRQRIDNIRINESLSREQIRKLIENNRRTPQKRFELIHGFIEENSGKIQGEKAGFFTGEERKMILNTYLESNLNFFKRVILPSSRAKYLFY